MDIQLKEDIKPLSVFRTDPASVIRQAREQQRPIIITERGHPTAVLVGLEEYERQRERMDLMEAILEGEKNFQEGSFKSLDQVFRDSRSWLGKK